MEKETIIIESEEIVEPQEKSAEHNEETNVETRRNNRRNGERRQPRRNRQRTVSEFEERVVAVKRISKTTKGGRMMRFSALVVVGNKKGVIGFGMGKSNEVPNAIKKAIKNANNNLLNIKINERGTLFHEVSGRHGESKVLLKPATTGKGIIAGGPVRAVVELAGFQDIYTKSLGSNTPINMIRATVDGLKKQFTPQEIAQLRDKEIKDL